VLQRNASDVGELVEGIASGGRDEGRAKRCPVENASHAYRRQGAGIISEMDIRNTEYARVRQISVVRYTEISPVSVSFILA
jgi:hypothetical protein